MTRIPLLLIGLALVASGCSGLADTAAAEQAVANFHELLDGSQFEQIYTLSADEMKRATERSDFVAFLSAVHRKLGNVKSSEKQNWVVNYGPRGEFLTVTYQTTFQEGQASEQFVFRMQGHSATLAGYRINSAALILK
jgi:hypothetical protein